MNQINKIIDLTSDTHETADEILMEGTEPSGTHLAVNSRFFTKNGIPWLPSMGEFQYSRYPERFWEEALGKIKASGIEIISSYVFWIHHEEIRGRYSWEGNNNLRRFVKLCADSGFYFFLRIGPWNHGECRNGGFPDWLLNENFTPRTNDKAYLDCVKNFYKEIYNQVKGLFFKDGGPIIGIQIENEYGHCGGLEGKAGLKHMRTLKKMAEKIGLKAPFYTATGWGGGIVVDNEMLPVMGAYAATPWVRHIKKAKPNTNYLFSRIRDDNKIGSDLSRIKDNYKITYTESRYPFLLCELGGGNQVSERRRPFIKPEDTESLSLVKIGSGANLLGYYMFHGGLNPKGRLSTMEENNEDNRYPQVTYDFQAPVREYGQISQSYYYLKTLLLFVKDFGHILAECDPVIPEDNPKDPENKKALRYAVRDNNGSGFLFINNYQRQINLENFNNISFKINTNKTEITFPEFNVISGRYCIFPYNLKLNSLNLKCSTSQLLSKISCGEEEYYFFFGYREQYPVYCFDSQGIVDIYCSSGTIKRKSDSIELTLKKMGPDSEITIKTDVNTIHIITLYREQAENYWKANLWEQEHVLICSGELAFHGDEIRLEAENRQQAEIMIFPDNKLKYKGNKLLAKPKRLFSKYKLPFTERNIDVDAERVSQNNKTTVWKLGFREPDNLSETYLHIDYTGHSATLEQGGNVLTDNFYYGSPWKIRLSHLEGYKPTEKPELHIKHLKKETDIYLEKKPESENRESVKLNSVKITCTNIFIICEY